MKKIFALMLAVLTVLGLWACGKTEDNYLPQSDVVQPEEEKLPDEAGKLTIYAETELQLVYNSAGNVISVTALNQPAEDIANSYDFTEKTCSIAVLELIDLVIDGELPFTKGFILVRQEPGSSTPGDDFLKSIREDAQLNKGEYPVIVTGTGDLDKEGLFSKETAIDALIAGYPAVEGNTVVCSEDPVGGSYSIFCTDAEGNTKEYAVSAVDGTVNEVATSEQTEPQSTEATDPIPESDVFDPIPDTEANKGADGGVDNGSVKLD